MLPPGTQFVATTGDPITPRGSATLCDPAFAALGEQTDCAARAAALRARIHHRHRCALIAQLLILSTAGAAAALAQLAKVLTP